MLIWNSCLHYVTSVTYVEQLFNNLHSRCEQVADARLHESVAYNTNDMGEVSLPRVD